MLWSLRWGVTTLVLMKNKKKLSSNTPSYLKLCITTESRALLNHLTSSSCLNFKVDSITVCLNLVSDSYCDCSPDTSSLLPCNDPLSWASFKYNMAFSVSRAAILSSFTWKNTPKCLSIWTPKTINFPFVPNGKLMVCRCPSIWAHDNYAVMCPNFEIPENCWFYIWNKMES